MGSDIAGIVIASQSSRCHHHPHPRCLLIVVFTAQGLATANVINVAAVNDIPATPNTAAKDNYIKVDKGG
jgi:hypothetical protein